MTKINIDRLNARLEELGTHGALPEGGVSRLALTDEDKQGRDLVLGWMKELGLDIQIDEIGNVVGTRKGKYDMPPVMIGSHIDTVNSGGNYDGCLGVLTGLEIVETLNENNIVTDMPIAVAYFTNEEGSRFAPDMMGSLCFVGDMEVEKALNTVGICGTTVKENLDRIGYAGDTPCGSIEVSKFFELHIEQGPVLERENKTIGVVESVQGISWTEVTLSGESCHAGTYPMAFRKDAATVAALVIARVREITREIGINHVATCGHINFFPNLINVVPDKVVFTVDMRNPNELELKKAEALLHKFIKQICKEEGIEYSTRQLARFLPTSFDEDLVDLLEEQAEEQGYSVRRMYSPAGHDAQILARVCPSAMIFIPCEKGLSHNKLEAVNLSDVEAGANTLLKAVVESASVKTLKLTFNEKRLSA